LEEEEEEEEEKEDIVTGVRMIGFRTAEEVVVVGRSMIAMTLVGDEDDEDDEDDDGNNDNGKEDGVDILVALLLVFLGLSYSVV
jgi:hypothetical protein